MRTRFGLTAILPLVALVAAWAAADPGAPPAALDDYDKPHDLIVAVDISRSMTEAFYSSTKPRKTLGASDPEGIRWDGVQFLIDISRPDDRVALVLFRAEAVVATGLFDESGFITLNKDYNGQTGRQLLKKIVADIQTKEGVAGKANRGKSADDRSTLGLDLKALESLPADARTKDDPRLNLWDGTSICFALEKIAPKKDDMKHSLLSELRLDRTATAFLFTDGFEENPFDAPPTEEFLKKNPGHEHKFDDYGYIKRLTDCKDNQAQLAEEVDAYVKPFREHDVPIFTFGLNEDCFMPFLQLISERSSPPGTSHPAESHYAPNNVVMLDQLRRVGWELRQNWYMANPPKSVRPNEDVFRTPPVGVWNDMGVLLFSEQTGAEKKRLAQAPAGGIDIHVVHGKQDRVDLPALTSRSHVYYSLSAENKVQDQVGADACLEFAFKQPAGGDLTDPRCYMVLRTEQPLFAYKEPETGAARYTPKDLIPLRVDFLPDAAGRFKAEDFEVWAALATLPEVDRKDRPVWPAADKNVAPLQLAGATGLDAWLETQRAAGKNVLPLTFANVAPLKPADSALQFRYEGLFGKEHPGLMLDNDPKSIGDNKNLAGPYCVDVNLTGRTGPLKGAERLLIRRTFQIKDYPDLKAPTGAVLLTNDDDSTVRAAVPVELDMITDPPTHVADLAVTVAQGPSVPGGAKLEPGKFRLLQGKDMAPGQELHLYGRKGWFYLELPAEEWAGLAADEYTGGALLVKAPWSKTPTTIPFSVRKGRYPLAARPIVVNLAKGSRAEVTQTISVTLKSKLDTQETVYLCEDPERYTDAAARELAFRSPEGKEIKLQVAGLGEGTPLRGGQEGGVALRITPPENLDPGRYQRKLYLAGPAVQPTEVAVEAAIDQAGVLEAGPDGNWIRDGAKGLKPFYEVSLAGLAGTRVRRTFALYSALGGDKAVPSQSAIKPFANLRGRDSLLPQIPEEAKERIDLDVPIPLAVEEGTYSSRLTLADPAHVPPLQAELLVNLQVVHYGVEIKENGPIHLTSKKGDPTAAAAATLITAVEKAPMRWYAEQVDPAELENEGRAGRVLPLGVLHVKAGPGAADMLEARPKDPLFQDKPLELRIEAGCAKLGPGLYWSKIRFYGYEDDPRTENGKPFELEVEVLVPGRAVQVLDPVGPDAQQGAETDRQVRVSCYGCDPDEGAWQAVDAAGKAVGPAAPIRGRPLREEEDRIPGLKHYTFAFKVRPERAGRNSYRVVWPPFDSGNAAENQLSPLFEVNANGVLKVEPPVASVNETVTLSVTADAGAAGAVIPLQAVNAGDADKQPISILLKDQGGGVYEGKQTFDRVGDYELSLSPGAAAGLKLAPATVHVVFELKVALSSEGTVELGNIEYGAGNLAALFGGKQEVSIPDAIQLKNDQGSDCQWRARLRYPTRVEDSRNISKAAPETTTSPDYDPGKHLESRLLAEGATEEKDSGWAWSGVLKDGETLSLGVHSNLSDPARAELWSSGSNRHPTLNARNGMIVEVSLKWPNSGSLERTVYVPVVVGTGPSYSLWILLVVVVVVAVVAGVILVRRYRKPRRRRALVGDEDVDPEYQAAQTAVAAPARRKAPAAKAAAPPPDDDAVERSTGGDGGSSGSDDDLLPEHMRGD